MTTKANNQSDGNVPPSATPKRTAAKPKLVPVLVLRDCWLGPIGAIVELEPHIAEAAVADGSADTHPAALRGARHGATDT